MQIAMTKTGTKHYHDQDARMMHGSDPFSVQFQAIFPAAICIFSSAVQVKLTI